MFQPEDNSPFARLGRYEFIVTSGEDPHTHPRSPKAQQDRDEAESADWLRDCITAHYNEPDYQ